MEKQTETEPKPSDMSHFEVIQALKCLQNDFIKLRMDWNEAREKVNEKLVDTLEANKETRLRLKQMEGKTILDFKNLARAKALGISPKSLLSQTTLNIYGEEAKEK